MFWAEQLARQVIERAKKEGKPASIRCGQTPSGGKHIGNLNDVVRAHFVYRLVKEKNYDTRFVHSSDDRDPLKDVPKKLADLEGNWHSSDKFPEMKNFLGRPLCRIPDPFGCCKSWSEHFTKVWEKGLNTLGMFPKIVSINRYYEEGRFDPYITKVFENIESVGKIISKFQETKGGEYIPFDAICPNCGMLSNISSFDLKKKTVHFTCGGKSIKKKRTEGCGFEGDVSIREGKLQWRFEWPAEWGIEQTTFEPFGKDHYEGSWKSGQVIAKEIYGIEPPIPYVYEFFLVDGQKMSASVGNVFIVQDMLKIIEPEVLVYFYTKRPGKQRDLSLKNIHLLVDEFDEIENKYFNPVKDEKEMENIKSAYRLSMVRLTEKKPLRIPYTYASMIAQIVPEEGLAEKSIEMLKSSGHIKGELSEDDRKRVEMRLKLSKYWAENYASEEYKIRLLDKMPKELEDKMSEGQKKSLNLLSRELLKKSLSEEELHDVFFEIAKKSGISSKEFFSAVYLALLGKTAGPRLAPFILVVGQKEIAKRLEI